MDDLIDGIRSFNRFYTRLVGALDAGHLATPYTLAEARVIYEIATRGRVSPKELATELALDPGYVTRLNARLSELGLLASARDNLDRRSTALSLTPEGKAAFAVLDSATNELFSTLLLPVDEEGRRRLMAAMMEIRELLGDPSLPPKGPVILRPHRLGELGWLIHRQGLIYNRQFGWNIEFEALIARIYSEFQLAPDAPPKNLWVAEQNAAVVGSIFVMPSEGIEGSAQLRMLYVEPGARGQGIGAALVAQCVGFAREQGYARMRLWTHTNQSAARKLYAAAGFAIVETMSEINFGKELMGEIWELRF